MTKSSSEAVRLPQRKQWTPPKPSYNSPKPMMVASRAPFATVQQPRMPVPSSYDRLPLMPSTTAKHLTDVRHDSFDPTIAPLAAAAALSLAKNTFENCLPTQPLPSADELDKPSLERLSSWSFDYSPQGSDSDSSPGSHTFSSPNFYSTPSCSPKTRVALLPSVPPLNLDTTNDRSVFESWENDDEDKQECLRSDARLVSGSPLATIGKDAAASAFAKTSRTRAPRRFFHARAASQQSCDGVDFEQPDGAAFAQVRESASSSADGHTSASRLQKLSKYVRQNSSTKASAGQHASDRFFEPRTDRDVFAPSSALHDDDNGSVWSSGRHSKPPPRLAKSSARSGTQRDVANSSWLGLENVPLRNLNSLPVVKTGDDSPFVITSRSSSRASKKISEDDLSSTSSPALRFDPARRPRAPFPATSMTPPAASSPTSSPIPRESPIVQSARPLRPIPIKAATLLGTLPGSMYAGAKYTASATSSSGSSDATLKPAARLSARPSSLAHQPHMPDLPPCPNRMHKLNDIIRPKASRPPPTAASAHERTPPRPARPTQRNIFAISDDEEGDEGKACMTGRVKLSQRTSTPPSSLGRPPRSSKRSNGPLPSAPPPPQRALPPIPSFAAEASSAAAKENVHTPPGWTSENPSSEVSERNNKTAKAVERQIFEAGLVEDAAADVLATTGNSTVVHIDVGGLTYATTLDILCPEDGFTSSGGMTAWLREECKHVRENSTSPVLLSTTRTQRRARQNSINSFDDGEDADDSGGISASSMASPVPSLSSSSPSSVSEHANAAHPSRLDRESAAGLTILRLPVIDLHVDSQRLDGRSGLARTPTSVSMDSAYHHHLEDDLKDASHAHDSGSTIEAWRNEYHCSQNQSANENAMPPFVFSPTRPATTKQRRLRITLPAHRNPLCYPAILFALQHHALPAYFAKRLPPAKTTTSEQRRRAALLLDVRDEAAWLGYSHLVALCDRYV